MMYALQNGEYYDQTLTLNMKNVFKIQMMKNVFKNSNVEECF